MTSPRRIETLRDDWKFCRGDADFFLKHDFEACRCETVRVPHDWAIAGPFDPAHDSHDNSANQPDVENGIETITGRTGGLPHVGIAWYRRSLDIPDHAEGRRVWLEFDGVMSQSTVYVNGHKIGHYPYGYSSFHYDVTHAVVPGAENWLAVRVDNPPLASRWYPGAGIYRKVRLVITSPVRIAPWGVRITTPTIEQTASVAIRTTLQAQDDTHSAVELQTHIKDPSGKKVGYAHHTIHLEATLQCNQSITLNAPQLWLPEAPNLYIAETQIVVAGEVIDQVEHRFGIRSLEFDAETGFAINGVPTKMRGVCLHHDLGPLGAAVNTAAIRRQLTLLKSIGCNAIRTSHNPPTPELLDLTDKMGFLTIDEAFDEWAAPKVKNGYNRHFKEWAETDLRAMIRRDANHPSVILWSIGNEIEEQSLADGGKVAQYLVDICHDEDPSRLTTAGFNQPFDAIENGLADAVDVPGWNYQPHNYLQFHQRMQGKPTLGSETASTVSSRGVYYFPAEEEVNDAALRESLQINSFDLSYPTWAYSPDVEFSAQQQYPFMMGEFVWTGFDYLGEPTPYYQQWPSRSSYFGIFDLCGLPKDRYYHYKSQWTHDPVLHLLPHWTWLGREGEILTVHCYTNYDKVELFLNGKSFGVQQKDPQCGSTQLDRIARPSTWFNKADTMDPISTAHRMVWPAVPYEAGELKAVALDQTGAILNKTFVHTAGAPATLKLTSEQTELTADGEDMAFIPVSVLDAAGPPCPTADHSVRFSITGPAEIVAVGNGDPTSLEPFQSDTRRLFSGKAVAYIRSQGRETGTITLTAQSEGMATAAIKLNMHA
ncbi:MAG: glycoside hydrolase family 2 protein [Verrucomicrobia bacterium]|nr:glycoside hydrolase family 2 protein [Verrucomicrobiota bacterium]